MHLRLFFHTDRKLSRLDLKRNTIYMTEIQCGSPEPFRKCQFETCQKCLYVSYFWFTYLLLQNFVHPQYPL